MSGEAAVITRPAWLVRWVGRLARVAIVGSVGILALLGLLTAVMGRPERIRDRRVESVLDLAAESFAEAFTRAYLTWDPAHPERRDKQVAAFASDALGPGAGLSVSARGAQRVVWTATVRDEQVSTARRLITVAAETSRGLPYYLSVSVQRDRRGLMAISNYPALVGAPPVNTSTSPVDETEVEDAELRAVARRAITNYLGREGANLRADLEAQAMVALPATPLKVASIDSITWIRPGRLAVELRAGGAGATWAFRYELDVVKRERWYVRSIETTQKVRRLP